MRSKVMIAVIVVVVNIVGVAGAASAAAAAALYAIRYKCELVRMYVSMWHELVQVHRLMGRLIQKSSSK